MADKESQMKSGTLCISVDNNYAHSLYRDKQDFDQYFWTGLTPKHQHGSLIPETTIMFVEEVVWNGERMAKIIHDGKTFYIQSHFIREI